MKEFKDLSFKEFLESINQGQFYYITSKEYINMTEKECIKENFYSMPCAKKEFNAIVLTDDFTIQKNLINGKYRLKKSDIIFHKDTNPENTEQLYKNLKELEKYCNVVNPIESKEICSSKWNSYVHLKEQNVPQPLTIRIDEIDGKNHNQFKEQIKDIKFPCIVKIDDGCQGEGVVKCDNFESCISTCQALLVKSDFVLVQNFIENDGDYRVYVVGDEVIYTIKRIKPKGDFRNNVSQGGTSEKVDLPEKAKKVAINVVKACKGIFIGVDLIEKDGNYYVLEVNSQPGISGFRNNGSNFKDNYDGNIVIFKKIIDFLKS